MAQYGDDSKEVQSLIEAMRNSTGETRLELEEVELDGAQPLRFVISEKGKLDKLKNKLGIANGRNGKGEHTKEKFSAPRQVLEKGIDGEITAPNNNHYWFNIKLVDRQIQIKLTTEQGGGEEFGTTVGASSRRCFVMPSLMLIFTTQGNDKFHFEFNASARAIMRSAQGLIMQPETKWYEEGDAFIVFDKQGRARAKKSVPKSVIVDMSANEAQPHTAVQRLNFYQGGEAPFTCFGIDDYLYCYTEDK